MYKTPEQEKKQKRPDLAGGGPGVAGGPPGAPWLTFLPTAKNRQNARTAPAGLKWGRTIIFHKIFFAFLLLFGHGVSFCASLSRVPCVRRWPETLPTYHFRRMYAKTAACRARPASAACIDFCYDAQLGAVPCLKVVQGHEKALGAESPHLIDRFRGENHAGEQYCSIRCAHSHMSTAPSILCSTASSITGASPS